MKTKFFSTDVACNVYLQGRTRRFAPTAYCHCLLLLVLLTATFCAAAQNGVTVSNLLMDAGTVTFKVSWDENSPVMPEVWSDSVWVFVDYNNNGTMERLPLLPGATLTDSSWDNAEVIEEPGNNNGVWVVGNARSEGSFSATVKLLTATATAAGACAYASNYPPVGEYTSVTNISFTGTPPYALVLKQVGGATTHTGASLDDSYLVPEGFTVESFTDKTGAPGIFTCAPSLKPTIDTHPTASTSICSGGTVSLSVTASSAATYQWKKNGAVITSEGSGYASATYTTAALSANATYSVVVSNGLSACSATSSNALVTVYTKPSITAHPAGTTTCSGTAVALSVEASSAATYQWKKNGAVITSEGSGYASAQYTTAFLTAGATYSVVVANGSCSVTSNDAVVSVETCCHASGVTATFAAFNPCSSAATGSYWYLTDTRESGNVQTYKVKKLADGHIWMVQDLKFGDKCNKESFSGSVGSDQTGKITILTDKTYYGDCRNNTQSGAGYLYDWAGAIQKSGAYGNSSSNVGCSGTAAGTDGTKPGACRGICPSGWHLPTGDTNGEFRALHNAIGGCSTKNDNCWDSSSAWEGVLGGHVTNNGTLDGQGSFAAYWSSTYNSSWHAYYLYFDSSVVVPGTNDYTSDYYKQYGRSVRCVMNY